MVFQLLLFNGFGAGAFSPQHPKGLQQARKGYLIIRRHTRRRRMRPSNAARHQIV
jgi:hypothetical protein